MCFVSFRSLFALCFACRVTKYQVDKGLPCIFVCLFVCFLPHKADNRLVLALCFVCRVTPQGVNRCTRLIGGSYLPCVWFVGLHHTRLIGGSYLPCVRFVGLHRTMFGSSSPVSIVFSMRIHSQRSRIRCSRQTLVQPWQTQTEGCNANTNRGSNVATNRWL